MKHLNSNTITLLIFMLCTTSSFGTVHRVNGNNSFNQAAGDNEVFSSLNAAIGSSNVLPGDTLHVEAWGSSYGQINLYKSLTIIGTGYFLSENTGLQKSTLASTIDNIHFEAGSSGSTITGLRIADSGTPFVYFDNVTLTDITVTRCYIEGGFTFQLNSVNNPDGYYDNIHITKNFVVGYVNQSGWPGPVTNLYIANNFFGEYVELADNQTGLVIHNVFDDDIDIEPSLEFYNNIVRGGTFEQNGNSSANIYNNVFVISQPSWLIGGSNNFSVPFGTVFVNTTLPDGALAVNNEAICPACYEGVGDVEVGMFGGLDPYEISGIPPIPAIYFLQSAPIGITGDTMNVTISTRTND